MWRESKKWLILQRCGRCWENKESKKMKLAKQLTAILVLIMVAILPAYSIGWGVEVGRPGADIGALVTDMNSINVSLGMLAGVTGTEFGNARQAALLGNVNAGNDFSKLRELARQWWKDRILEPGMAIVKNPAASCAEANYVAALFIGQERQSQFLGVEDDEVHRESVEVIRLGRQRCREEAIDECHKTGRFQQIVQTALGQNRQGELLGNGEGDTKWAEDALKECAIYELHFVSTSDIDELYPLKTVVDGKIKIKPPEDLNLLELGNGKQAFEGETEGEGNPYFVSISCKVEDVPVTCSPGSGIGSPAWAKLMKMEMKHREYYVDEHGISKDRVVGGNEFKLQFEPAALMGRLLLVPPVGPKLDIEHVMGGLAFRIAHKKNLKEDKIEFTDAQPGGYPVLFDFTATDSDETDDVHATDSTKFELIHKPNAQKFTTTPEPPRKVIRPKSPTAIKPKV
jgi:hypothetical protein